MERGAKSLSGPSIVANPKLYEYQKKYGFKETEQQIALRKRIEESQHGQLASAPDESEFLALLVDITNAKNVIGLHFDCNDFDI